MRRDDARRQGVGWGSRRLRSLASGLLVLTGVWLAAGPASAHDWNGLALDANGHVHVIDAEDGQVWKVKADGTYEVFVQGSRDLCHPHHLAFDEEGSLWLPSG